MSIHNVYTSTILLPMPRSMKPAVQCCIMLVVNLLVSAIITATAITAYHYITVENEIKEVDLQSNSDLNHTLLQKIQQLENSFTAKIHELEVAHSAELTEMREALNATEERLVNATIMIQDLEEKHLTVFREMERALDETEGKLEEATATLLMLEDSYFMTIAAIQREVNVTKVKLDDTTGKIAELEEGLSGTETAIASLNVSKASKAIVDGLTERVEELEIGKVDKTEFEILSGNVTSLRETISAVDEDIRQELSELASTTLNLTHYDQLQDGIQHLVEDRTSDFLETVNVIDNTTVAMQRDIQQLIDGKGQTREELNETRETLYAATASITVLEDALNDTTQRTSALEVELANTKMEISSLNETKASKASVEELTEELEIRKVDKTEFEILSGNVTSLRETTSAADEDIRQELSVLADSTINHTHYNQLQNGIQHLTTLVTELNDSTEKNLETVDGFHNTTLAMQSDIEQLTNDHRQTREELNETRERIHNARASITVLEYGLNDTKHRTSVVEGELANTKMEVSSLNETKASKVSVNELTERVEELEIGKVDRTEFEVLSDNVTSLRETTSVVDEEIHGELSDLADNTVRTSDFLETVGSIYNTTVVIQTDIVQLTQRLTSLAHNTTVALSTKADQHEVNTLSEQLTTLSEETVRKNTFQSAIDSLSTSKAEQSDLNSLEGRVDHLENTIAKKDQLNSLEHEVTNHISDSQSTHSQLSSRIGSNDADIGSNTQRIDQLEADVADSSPGLKQLWTLAMVPAVIMG